MNQRMERDRQDGCHQQRHTCERLGERRQDNVEYSAILEDDRDGARDADQQHGRHQVFH